MAGLIVDRPAPDAVGKANAVARATGVPPETADRNLAQLERTVEMARAARVMGREPTVATWAANPRNAAVGADDVDQLARNAEYWRRAANGTISAAPKPAPTLWNGLVGIGASLLQGFSSAGANIRGVLSDWLPDVPVPKSAPGIPTLGDFGRENDRRARAQANAQIEAATPEYKSWYGRGIYGGASSIAQNAPSVAIGLLTGTAAPALTAMALQTGIPAYNKYRDRGGTRGQALVGGALEGGIEAGTEALPMGFLVDNLGKRGASRFISGFLGRELPGEFAATLGQNAVDTAIANPNKTWGQYLAEQPDALVQTAIGTLMTAGLYGGIHHVARRYATDAIDQARSATAAGNLDQAMSAAAASKTRQRDPQAFADLVGLHTQDTPIERLFVPAEAADRYFQAHDINPNEDDFWSGYADQIAAARATGGDIVISTAQAAAHLAGTPAWDELRPDVRTSPGGMSQAEADSWRDQHDEHIQRLGSAVADQVAAAAAASEPRQRIYQNIRDQLTNAGYTQSAADLNAQLVASRYATRAERLGQTLTGTEADNIRINSVLPQNLAPIVAADPGRVALKSVVNVMRRGLGVKVDSGPSLVEWIARNGGIEDRGGDIAAMGGTNWHRGRPGRRKLIRPHADAAQGALLGAQVQQNLNTPDELALRAQEAGYFPAGERPTVNDLLDAIGTELRGSPVYAEAGPEGDRTRAAADELAQILDQRGLDPKTATEREIEQAIDSYRQEQAGGYRQEEPVAATVKGDEIGPFDAPTAELRKAAREWYDANLKGKSLPSNALGGLVKFASSRKAFSSSADPRKLRAFAALPELLLNGQLVNSLPPVDQSREPSTRAYHFIRGDVKIAGERHPVGIMVREDNNGHFFYNHSMQDGAPAAPEDTASKAGPGDEGAPLRQDIVDSGDGINMTVGQNGPGPRGQITFQDGGAVIYLFQHRDASTFIHEAAHKFAVELQQDAGEGGALADDWQTVKDWFAANGHPVSEDGAIPVEAHELWARGFERYVMEGKSPSSALRRAFEAFRGWLLNIYKVVDNLRSPITPEIRQVMNRLVATDEEIAMAEDRQSLDKLFSDAAQAGMTEQEFAAYQAAAAEARDEAHDALLYRTMAAIRRERTAAWKAERDVVRAEIADRVNQRPEFRALHLLRTGRQLTDAEAPAMRAKLDKAWLLETYGEGILASLPKGVPPIYAETETMNADDIAELSGFASGDEMVRTLVTVEERTRALRDAGDQRSVRQILIDEETAAEMQQRHGDPLNDGSIEEDALAAVHNDRQGEVIASELRALSRRANEQPTPYQLARDWARRKIAESTVADAASGAAIQQYARAAAKAGREAEKAMIALNINATFRHKQAQMLNNALVAEAGKAREAVTAARDRLARYARRRTMPSMDQDYLERIHDLLEQVEFRQRSQRSIERQGSFEEWARGREAEGHDVIVPASFAASLGTTHWSRLSVEKLLGLDEAVDQIAHLGRFKQKLIDGAEERAHDEVVGEALASIEQLPARPPLQFDPSWSERMKARVESADAGLLKMETIVDWLDGGNSNGPFNRIVFRPIADAQAREQDMTADYFARIRQHMDAVPNVARWAERVVVPELMDNQTGGPFSATRQRLVAMALNMGNEGNKQRLTDGYGWSEAGVLSVLNRELTADDWRFVQSVWDTIDTLWPEISAMERRVNGVAPEKVEAVPIETSAGTLRGGYYPAIYDTERDLRAEKHAGMGSDLLDATYTRATSRASATKDRIEKVTRPILLEVGVINRHLGEVIHDITHREAIINAHKFLFDTRVQEAVNATLGPAIRKQFRPWLKHVANQWAAERAGNEGLARFMSKARANTTAVGMGFRLSTVLTQVAGYANSQEVLGGAWLPNAIAQSVAHPIETFNFVIERSGEIRHRMETMDRDIGQLMRSLDLNPLAKGLDVARQGARFMYHGIGYADRLVVIPTWVAAYNKALAAGQEEQAAIYSADKAVRQSQGSGGAKDLAAIQRGTGSWGEALKLSTMFYSYFSALYQRHRTLGRDAAGTSGQPRDLPAVMARAMWLIVIPPILSQLIAGRGPDDDDDWGIWAFKQMLFNALAPIPFVRDLAQPAWDKAAGNKSFGYQLSPVQRAGETAVNVAGDIGKIARGEPTKRATADALEATGYVTGLVPGQLATAAQFLVDVGHGDQDPESVGDWYRGVTRGKAKPAS